jgi:iron complex outermembrane receptor protein
LKANQRLSYAVIAVLSAHAGAAYAQTAATPAVSGEIAEITVTAQRRTENIQNVPITIQALTGEALAQLNVTTFEDYVKFLPNVTAQGLGPGQNNIYMRGLSTAVGALQGSGVVGSFPNVAVYLDDQSGQLPGRNLDVYAADLERIEVLEGPQGTLFGAGAQAGVVRYITNKPKIGVTEASANAGYAVTAHGDPSNSIDAMLNLPFGDQFALRAVIYNESRGGYINNIPATFVRNKNDLGSYYFYNGGVPPKNSATLNNNSLVGRAINPVVYKGMRLSALYQISDDWNVLLQQSYQNMEADGVFAEMVTSSDGKPQPDLSVQQYNPSYDKDKFESTSWTLNGRAGPLKLVYTGSYLVRNVEQVQDYTNYVRGKYANYYQCVSANPANGNPTNGNAPQCFSPSSTWRDIERNAHQSHEARLSTPDDFPVRGLAGLFYENYKIQEQVDWFYETATPYFSPIAPPTGYFTLNGSVLLPNGHPVKFSTPGAVFVPGHPATANNPNVRPPGDAFFDDITRGYMQKAAFGSIDVDLIPKALTLTAGTRYYRIENFELGSAVGSFGCKQFPPGGPAPNPCVNHSNETNLDALGLDKIYKGFKSRANLTWHVMDDVMVYYTWSQGFRAGGFNRPNSVESSSPLTGKWLPPVTFDQDNLVNNEVGWKTEWWSHRIQWNGAIYQEDWKGAQISLFDPGVTGNLTFTTNGGDYRVKGLETSLLMRATEALTLSAGAAWNQSKLVKQEVLVGLDGKPLDLSTIIYRGQPLANPGGNLGDPLAGAPPFQANVRVRYDFRVNTYDAFWQLSGQHQAHSYASTDRLTLDLQGNSIAYDQPGFTTYDGALGVSKDAWTAQFYGSNLTDVRADLFTNARQWYKAETVNRPRTLGLRFSYKFSGNK